MKIIAGLLTTLSIIIFSGMVHWVAVTITFSAPAVIQYFTAIALVLFSIGLIALIITLIISIYNFILENLQGEKNDH